MATLHFPGSVKLNSDLSRSTIYNMQIRHEINKTKVHLSRFLVKPLAQCNGYSINTTVVMDATTVQNRCKWSNGLDSLKFLCVKRYKVYDPMKFSKLLTVIIRGFLKTGTAVQCNFCISKGQQRIRCRHHHCFIKHAALLLSGRLYLVTRLNSHQRVTVNVQLLLLCVFL